MKNNSFFTRLLDLVAPRTCVVCGNRLSIEEEILCATCNFRLPRTEYSYDAYDNEMAKVFWGRIPVERCAPFMYYQAQSASANLIYQLKYNNRPDIGEYLGKMMAEEFKKDYFFEDIDLIIPIPLEWKRQRQRGYNQSLMVARGVSDATGLPIDTDIIIRKVYESSQTEKNRWMRNDNVEGVFQLLQPEKAQGKHILLIDDVVTTGATVCSCGQELAKAGDVKISVLSIGFVKP
ncbi:MAG: ComF family protein [Prevotella sp.]|nr:ComF family protein [Prevotella sp.]